MVKRDRWDSSSEDEGKPVAKNAISKKKSKDETSKLKQEEKEIFRSHNPLLQGCRSVYDTYERLARISEGTYGVVWKAIDRKRKKICAVKKVFDAFHNATDA